MAVEITIIQDSKEQKGLFKECEVKGLKTGDYSFKTDIADYSNVFAIERKSGIDAIGTCGKGHDRFQRELERAQGFEYFAILIECPYRDFKAKKFPSGFRSPMPGSVAAKIWMTYHMKYNIPIFFANDRFEARTLIKDLAHTFMRSKEKRT